MDRIIAIFTLILLTSGCQTMKLSTTDMTNAKNMDLNTFNQVVESFPVGDSFDSFEEELEKFNHEQGDFYIDLILKKDDYNSSSYKKGFEPTMVNLLYNDQGSRVYEAQNGYGAKFQVTEYSSYSDRIYFDRNFIIKADKEEAKNLVNKTVRVYFKMSIPYRGSPAEINTYKKKFFCGKKQAVRATPSSPLSILNDGCTIYADVKAVTFNGTSINFE